MVLHRHQSMTDQARATDDENPKIAQHSEQPQSISRSLPFGRRHKIAQCNCLQPRWQILQILMQGLTCSSWLGASEEGLTSPCAWEAVDTAAAEGRYQFGSPVVMDDALKMPIPVMGQFEVFDVRLPGDTVLMLLQPSGKVAACHPCPPGAPAGILLVDIALVSLSITGNKVALEDAIGGLICKAPADCNRSRQSSCFASCAHVLRVV